MRNFVFTVIATLFFTGCVTSPYLAENAQERLAAVDAVTDQHKLVEIALDYCTEPYQELPTGCQIDVRRRAVERLTDQDLLMAVASFSIVKATIRGKKCYVTLGEPNSELKALALDKLTEARCITSVLAAKDAFEIQHLFTKSLFGYCKIAGDQPSTAERAWIEKAKSKETAVSKAFCDLLHTGNTPVEFYKKIYGLFPKKVSTETQQQMANSYKRIVTSAGSVSDVVRSLQLADVLPVTAIDKNDIDAMFKKVCSYISTINDFREFTTLLNGVGKKYVSGGESMIQSAATQVVPKLNGMQELADFARVLEECKSPWVGQIGIEEQVRKYAVSVDNVGSIAAFVDRLSSFNEVILPNKTDIASDALARTLNVVSERKVTKESIQEFVKVVVEFPTHLLNDKVIMAIFANDEINEKYEQAIRADGLREKMGNEIVGAVMKSRSFGDLLVGSMMSNAMGLENKESPMFTKMFGSLIAAMRSGDAFVNAAKHIKIFYPRNMLIEEAEKRMDGIVLAKCLLAVSSNFPESAWCIGKILLTGKRFVAEKNVEALVILQPVFLEYSRNKNALIRYRAASCLDSPSKILEVVANFDMNDFRNKEVREAFFASITRANQLFIDRQQIDAQKKFNDDLATKIASDNSLSSELRQVNYNWANPFMDSIARGCPELWASIMSKIDIDPDCPEFCKVVAVLSCNPSLLVNFLANYRHDPCQTRYSSNPKIRKNQEWVDYIPYFSYRFGIAEGNTNWKNTMLEYVYYYDCDWFWQALCTASTLELSKADRDKLNEVMKFVALNTLNLDVRKKVFDTIKGDVVKKEIESAWAELDSAISTITTEFFNFSLDDSLSKVKWESEWKKRYEHKRLRLRGTVVEVSQTDRHGQEWKDRFFLTLDGASDLTDLTFAKKVTENHRKSNAERDLDDARNTLNEYKKDFANTMKRFKDGKIKISINDVKKNLTLKEYVDMGGFFWCKKGQNPEEAIAEQEKNVSELEARVSRVSLYYKIEIPATFGSQIVKLEKGDIVVFEAYPHRVYRRTNETNPNGGKMFIANMTNGRVITHSTGEDRGNEVVP